jgi:hypothetical protein
MDNILGMQILQCYAHLPYIVCCDRLGITLIRLFLEILVELTPRSILQNEIDLLLIPKEAIHSQNVVIAEV